MWSIQGWPPLPGGSKVFLEEVVLGLTNWEPALTPKPHHCGSVPWLWPWNFLQTSSYPDLHGFLATALLTSSWAHSAPKCLQSVSDIVVLPSEAHGFNPALWFCCHSYRWWGDGQCLASHCFHPLFVVFANFHGIWQISGYQCEHGIEKRCCNSPLLCTLSTTPHRCNGHK